MYKNENEKFRIFKSEVIVCAISELTMQLV